MLLSLITFIANKRVNRSVDKLTDELLNNLHRGTTSLSVEPVHDVSCGSVINGITFNNVENVSINLKVGDKQVKSINCYNDAEANEIVARTHAMIDLRAELARNAKVALTESQTL